MIAFDRMKTFLPNDVINNAEYDVVPFSKTYTDGVDGQTMQEISSAIQRIDNPVVLVVL